MIPSMAYCINRLRRELKLWDQGLKTPCASINMIWGLMARERRGEADCKTPKFYGEALKILLELVMRERGFLFGDLI